MFIKIKEGTFVNLEQVKEIFLKRPEYQLYDENYIWEFIYSNSPWNNEDSIGYLVATSKPLKQKKKLLNG